MSENRSTGPTTRKSLFGRLLRNRQAWQTFYEIYAPIVYRYARHASLPACDAEDVVANVMRNLIRVVQRGFRLDPKLRFRHYLRRTTGREIAAQRRRYAQRPVTLTDLPEPSDAAPPATALWSAIEREERLRMCWDRLRHSPRMRARDVAAFERYVLRNEPAKRVAKQLGLSKSRIYSIKHEIIQQLRQVRIELDSILGEV